MPGCKAAVVCLAHWPEELPQKSSSKPCDRAIDALSTYCHGVSNIPLSLSDPADRLPMRRVGLLGRRRRPAHHLPRPHADDQDLVQGRRADDRRVGVRGVAPPRHPLHREPLLTPAAAEDGSHFQGEKAPI